MATTKTTEISRPDAVLLHQPWSTATIQTKNSTIAAVANPLSHMVSSPSFPQITLPFREDRG
jgi:hypothetical protein